MTVGDVFNEAWEYYTRFFWRFVLTTGAIFVLLDLLAAIAADARGKDRRLAFAWGLVSGVGSFVGSFWVQGTLVAAVDDARDGRLDATITELYRKTRPYLLTLLGTGVIAAMGVTLGLLAFVVPGLLLLTRWSIVVPVVVLERRTTGAAFARSSQLVRGNGWAVFAIVLLTAIFYGLSFLAFAIVFSPLPTFAGVWLGGLVSHSLVVPFMTLAWTVTYYRLRELETRTRAVPRAAG